VFSLELKSYYQIMNKTQKLAIKNSIKTLQEVVAGPTMAELLVESFLTDAFPEIAAELQEPEPENKNQLKFNFVLDNP
jgi:hypothetical protein